MDEKRITITGYVTAPREMAAIATMRDQGYRHINTHSVNYDDGVKEVTLVFEKSID